MISLIRLIYILPFLLYPSDNTVYSLDIVKKEGELVLRYDSYGMSDEQAMKIYRAMICEEIELKRVQLEKYDK